MLYKNNCIRTKKKQKVFYWFSVPHDRLFLDALERDLKREKLGIETTSVAMAEPATSLSLDSTQELFDHLRKSLSLVPGTSPSSSSSSLPAITNNTPKSGDDLVDDDTSMQNASEDASASKNKVWLGQPILGKVETSCASLDLGQPPHLMNHRRTQSSFDKGEKRLLQQHVFRPSRSLDLQMTKKIFGKLPLFDGSPTYKQRRHRAASVTGSPLSMSPVLSEDEAPIKRPMISQLAKAAKAAGYYEDDGEEEEEEEEGEETSKTLISTASYNALAKATSALASVMNDDPRAKCTFTCPLHACGRLFRRLEQLKRHLRTHTLHRPHHCQTCGKRFSRSDNLAQHKKVHQKTTHSTFSDIHAAAFQNANSDPIDAYLPFYPNDTMDNMTLETTGTMMDYSYGSLSSSVCNSPDVSFTKQPGYYYYYSAASSLVPSPSSSTSSPYASTQDYHYQLQQQQQMQALQQALNSCMKPSQVSHRWSCPETTTSSLLTSPFVPPFLVNETEEDWTQWAPPTMNLNDLDAFASSS